MHIVGYAVLAALINLSSPRQGPSQAWALTLTCGVLIELAQAFIPQREAAWDDLVSNIMGAGLGVWLTSRRVRLVLHMNRRKGRQVTANEADNQEAVDESPSANPSEHRD